MDDLLDPTNYSVEIHQMKSQHGLIGRKSNNGVQFEQYKKLFSIFVQRNRNPTERQKGYKYFLDPVFVRLKNSYNTPFADKHESLTYAFQEVMLTLHEKGTFDYSLHQLLSVINQFFIFSIIVNLRLSLSIIGYHCRS